MKKDRNKRLSLFNGSNSGGEYQFKTRMKKYIGMLTSTASRLIEKINTALSVGDFEEIASQVQSL